jgi:hypothetical protein
MGVFFLSWAAMLAGCQDEFDQVTPPPAGEAITAETPLAGLIRRVTMRDGSADNLIDHTSCTSLVFPVTVLVNGVRLTIAGEADFEKIENLLDSLETDIDTVVMVFPVRVVLPDHREVTVLNQQQFNALAANCDGWEDDIECIDFVYPLTVLRYDANNQAARSQRVVSDRELHQFFLQLPAGVFVSFNFPVQLRLYNGTTQGVNNLAQLEAAIRAAIGVCDEDDDPDYHNEDAALMAFKAALVNGRWRVADYFNEVSRTAEFNGFIFVFHGNGSVTATRGGTVVAGSWEVFENDTTLTLLLDFDQEDEPFVDIQTDWDVVARSDNRIELRNDDESPALRLVFERV